MRTLLHLAIVCGSMAAVPIPNASKDDDGVPENRGPLFYWFHADADGVIRIFVERIPMGADKAAAVAKANDPFPFRVRVPLKDLVDLKISTADGRKLDAAELQRLHPKGGCFIGSRDGKPISPAYRRMFRGDAIFVESPELIHPELHNHYSANKVVQVPAESKDDESAFPTSQPPGTMYLNPDKDGNVRLPVWCEFRDIDPITGQARIGFSFVCVSLKNVMDLKIVQVNGTNVTIEEAERRLSKSGFIVLCFDSGKISPGYRKLLRDEVMVFYTSEDIVIGTDVAGRKLREEALGKD